MLTCSHCTTGAPRRCHRADQTYRHGQLTISSHVTRQAAHRHSLLFPHPSLYLVGGLDFALLISALFCCRVLIFSTSIAAGPLAVLLLAHPPPFAPLCERFSLLIFFGCRCRWELRFLGELVLLAQGVITARSAVCCVLLQLCQWALGAVLAFRSSVCLVDTRPVVARWGAADCVGLCYLGSPSVASTWSQGRCRPLRPS